MTQVSGIKNDIIQVTHFFERKLLLKRNLATILPLKSKLSGKFQSFNAIDGSIKMLKNRAYRNSWTLDARVGRWTLDTGLWMLDSGFWTLETRCWTLDHGLWTMDPGPWMLDAGLWPLDTGLWTLDSEPWTLDAGLWTLNARLWTLKL